MFGRDLTSPLPSNSTAGPGRHVFVVKTDRPMTTLVMELSVLLRPPSQQQQVAGAAGESKLPPGPPFAASDNSEEALTEVSCGRIRFTLSLDELSTTQTQELVLPVRGIKEEEIVSRRTGFMGRVVQMLTGGPARTATCKLIRRPHPVGVSPVLVRDSISYLPWDVVVPVHAVHTCKLYRELWKERALLPAQPLTLGVTSDVALGAVLPKVLDMPDALQVRLQLRFLIQIDLCFCSVHRKMSHDFFPHALMCRRSASYGRSTTIRWTVSTVPN